MTSAHPPSVRGLVLCLLLGAAPVCGLATSANAQIVAGGFERLEGHWTCAGRFIASGRALASTIAFAKDAGSGALVVHHDDTAPNAYHALEVWSPGKANAAWRASISESYGGMRWFESPGWDGPALAWTRSENGQPIEQFAYILGPGGRLTVNWSVARGGGALQLGDTLSCTRNMDG